MRTDACVYVNARGTYTRNDIAHKHVQPRVLLATPVAFSINESPHVLRVQLKTL